MVVSMVVGIALGLTSAFFGGIVDVIIIRIMDLIMAIPSLVLAILIIAIIGPNLTNTIVAVTIVGLPRYVRLVRASALTELTKDYVTAAKVSGVRQVPADDRRRCCPIASHRSSCRRRSACRMPFSRRRASASSVSAPSRPRPNGAAMLADSRDLMLLASLGHGLPGPCHSDHRAAINLMGDGLRDALDPRLRRS